MSYVLNMVGGGGGFSACDAILRVVAPAGSTVIVTKGSVNKTLPPFAMSGTQATNCYYYVVKPSAFDSTPWTVSATSGSDTSTDTVVINSAGEYIMQLSFFDGVLYYAGDEATNYTGGFETFSPAFALDEPIGCTKNAATLSIAFTSGSDNWYNGAFGTVNKVDLSDFTTLHVLTTSASHSGSVSNFAAFGVQGTDSSVTAKHTQTNYPPGVGTLAPTAAEPCANLVVGDNTLDVSALSEGFIWFGGSSRGSGSCNIVVTKIWLS